LTDFPTNIQIQIFMEIRRVGAKLFHAHGKIDGRTDRQTERYKHEEANSLFRNFTNASTNWTESPSCKPSQQIT